MNNIEFMELLSEQKSSKDKYKKENNTYKNGKSEMSTLSDWKRKSEHCIKTHVYDIGKGEFVTAYNLEKDMNKVDKAREVEINE